MSKEKFEQAEKAITAGGQKVSVDVRSSILMKLEELEAQLSLLEKDMKMKKPTS